MKSVLFSALLIFSSVGYAKNHPIDIVFPAQEKTIAISNGTTYPIVSTEVSGSRGFLAVSGWDQVLFSGDEDALVFTIDTAQWGCFYTVSMLSSDGVVSEALVSLCQERNSHITLSPSDEEYGEEVK